MSQPQQSYSILKCQVLASAIIGLFLAAIDIALSLIVYGTTVINTSLSLFLVLLFYFCISLIVGLILQGFWRLLSAFLPLGVKPEIPTCFMLIIALFYLLAGCHFAYPALGSPDFTLLLALVLGLLVGSAFLCFSALFFWARGLFQSKDLLIRISNTLLGILLLFCTLLIFIRTFMPHSLMGKMVLAGGGLLGILLASLLLLLPQRYKINIGFCIMAMGLSVGTSVFFQSEFGPGQKGPQPGGDSKNLILITCDALRADCLKSYGGNTTAAGIRQLAREGMRFERAVSTAPWTLPSMVSLFSERYPSLCQSGGGYRVSESFSTLAEDLSSKGYQTLALVGNYGLSRSTGIHQGFQKFELFYHHALWADAAMELKEFGLPSPLLRACDMMFRRLFLKNRSREDLLPDTSRQITDRAIQYLKNSGLESQPFFLWIHYMDPHDPFYPPSEYFEEVSGSTIGPYMAPHAPDLPGPQVDRIRAGNDFLTSADREQVEKLYWGDVRYVGDLIGEVLKVLKQAGFEENTWVVLTSDHGEEFWDHGDFYHGQSLYHELVDVPLILKGPGIPAGSTYPENFSLIHLMATLRGVLDLPPSEGSQGTNLWPAIQGTEPEETLPCFNEGTVYYEPRVGVLMGKYKLVKGTLTGRCEMYNLADDPGELKDLSGELEEQKQVLLNLLEQWQDQNTSLKQGKEEPESSETKEILSRFKKLGYL